MEPIATNYIKDMYTYFGSFDWSEPWLYVLIAIHVTLALSIALTRKYTYVQGSLFLIMLSVVHQAESLNEVLARNHRLFTQHQYFDSSGMFISVVLSLPFLLLCSAIVCNWFMITVNLMRNVRIKKTSIKEKKEK